MIKHAPTSFNGIPKDDEYEAVLDGLLDDRSSFWEIESYLQSCELFKLYAGKEYIGFYSVENGREIHFYILPSQRKHSIRALKYVESITPKPISTSVYGTHTHVTKLLQRMGFQLVGVQSKAYLKDGNYYAVYFMQKEDMNNG